jgi:hypothetical protein
MGDIIVKKPYERFNWKVKLNALSPSEARAWQIKEYRRCAEDNEYWFKQYAWTFDPRENPTTIPFMLYDYQSRLIKELDQFQDIFIDKSRQMGISWTLMGWELHKVLYTKGFTCLNISRKESEVQDGGNTYHSLHGRLKFMYDRLPPYLKPAVRNPFLVFQVPSMDSVIKGESSNPRAGRDSQYKFVLVDEAAHIDCLDEMWKGLRSACNSICLNSTPPKEISNNKFAEIKEMGNKSGFKYLQFHWREHPKYTEEWYKKKTASMTEQEIAQELEIKYDAALTNRSYIDYNKDIHLLKHKIYLNPKSKLYCFQDYGLSGEVFLYAQKDYDDRIYFIYYKIYKEKLTPELYRCMLNDLVDIGYLQSGMTNEEIYDKISNMVFVGDRSGSRRNRQTKTSVMDEYRRVSKGAIKIKYKEISNDEKMKTMKACLKKKIKGQPQFNISKEKTCLKFDEAMRKLQLNKKRDDHVDNEYTHVVNAAEYGINYLFPRKKDNAAMVCVEPGQEVEKKDGETEVYETKSNKAASATAIIGSHRIERKGVIIQ